MVSVNKGDWNRLTSVDQIHEFNIQGKLSVHVAGASSPIKCRLATRSCALPVKPRSMIDDILVSKIRIDP